MSLESSVLFWDKLTFRLAFAGAILVTASAVTSWRYRSLNRQLLRVKAAEAQREKNAAEKSKAEANARAAEAGKTAAETNLKAAEANEIAEQERKERIEIEASVRRRTGMTR